MNSLPHLIRQVEAAPATRWALATLVRAQGSSYRRLGARMIVASDGTRHGTVSGGCLEEEIARRGRGLIAERGAPALISFDTRLLYGCDGRIEVLLEEMAPAAEGNLLTQISSHFEQRRTCGVRVVFAGAANLGSSLWSGTDVDDQAGVFVQRVPPPVRLLVFGHGPEVASLRELAVRLGWVFTAFAHPADLPADFAPDDRTGAVVMNHHFGRDLVSIERVFPLGLPYVGLLGPLKRRIELLARFQDVREPGAAGFSALHAPAGLDLGGESPEEIALSIIAEVSAVFAGRNGGFLRDRKKPIHDCRVLSRETRPR